MSLDPIFASVTRALLQGQILCEVSNEVAYQYLSDAFNFNGVKDYLARLERTLERSSDQKAIYCAYLDIEDDDANKAIRSQFKEVAQHLESLVKFLSLCRVTHPGSEPLSAGSHLYESELLRSIEHSGAAAHLLDDLARGRFVNSNATDGKGKLKTLLQRLVEHGYLVSVGRSGAHFIATAKWSWLYDTLNFIQAHERLEEDSDIQSGDNLQQKDLF